MEFKNIIIEVKDDIGWLKFNRPNALNALNTVTITELEQALNFLNSSDDVKAIIITGEGKAFIAGADISEMKSMTPIEAREFSRIGQRAFDLIENMEKPVIAAINGFALGGGCELAMACDIRIASEKAKFGQPEVGLGVIPGFAGTQRLSRICGVGVAKELIFTGSIIDAKAAQNIGLVNRVVAPDNLIEEVLGLAKKIIRNGSFAVSVAKTVINRGLDSSFQTGCSYEVEAFGLCFSTNQPKEGMGAFLEKRKPNW